jgi:hypothetical protein
MLIKFVIAGPSLVRGSASCLLSLQALPALSRRGAPRLYLGLTDILGLRVKPAMTNLINIINLIF